MSSDQTFIQRANMLLGKVMILLVLFSLIINILGYIEEATVTFKVAIGILVLLFITFGLEAYMNAKLEALKPEDIKPDDLT